MSESCHRRMIRVLKILVSAVITLSVTNCVFQGQRECERYEGFFRLSMSDRDTELPRYPAEQQVDICICGMYREPPASYLAYTLAHSGESVIPLLVERLKSRRDEAGQRNIVYILKIVSREGLLRGRADVVAEIERVVANMKDEMMRTASGSALDEIRSNVNPVIHQ